MSIDNLLAALPRVKSVGQSRWTSGCPICQSKNGRPISIRALDDGRVLLHPFCGCGTSDVLESVGLGLSDLFEKPLGQYFEPSHSSIPARDLLEVIAHETTVAALIAEDLVKRRQVNEAQVSRLFMAASRIAKARSHAR